MTHLHWQSLMRSTSACAEKPPKIYGVRRPDARAGEQGDGELGRHAHINRYAVALLYAERLQHVGALRNFGEQLLIGQRADFAGFAFPDEGGFIFAPGGDVPVETVMREVELAADEPFRPRDVPLENLLPWLEPVELASRCRPRRFGVAFGFGVEALVVGDALDMRLRAEVGRADRRRGVR